MSNRNGTAYALTTFTRIQDGREDELEDYLEAMPRGAASPLAKVESLHLSRIHIFRKLVHQGPPSAPGRAEARLPGVHQHVQR